MSLIPISPAIEPTAALPPCGDCRDGEPLGFTFSYAFQPIIDLRAGSIFAHEALVRGTAGAGALSVLAQVNDTNRYRFDQACRVKAIEVAARLGMRSRLSINFLPNAIYRPEVCIRTTLQAARQFGFPVDQIIFETVESERIDDGSWLAKVFSAYQRIGFMTAIDDFGAGYAGLNLLADFQPDIVKLDMALVRGIEQKKASRVIVACVVRMCDELGIRVIAEGVETREELACLQEIGVHLVQGYLFGKPLFEQCVADIAQVWPVR